MLQKILSSRDHGIDEITVSIWVTVRYECVVVVVVVVGLSVVEFCCVEVGFVVVVVVVCCCVVFCVGFVVGVWEVGVYCFQVNGPEANGCCRLLHEVLVWSQGLFCCC